LLTSTAVRGLTAGELQFQEDRPALDDCAAQG
jgi:hypothetical protein